jgi:hypothetical protein
MKMTTFGFGPARRAALEVNAAAAVERNARRDKGISEELL